MCIVWTVAITPVGETLTQPRLHIQVTKLIRRAKRSHIIAHSYVELQNFNAALKNGTQRHCEDPHPTERRKVITTEIFQTESSNA